MTKGKDKVPRKSLAEVIALNTQCPPEEPTIDSVNTDDPKAARAESRSTLGDYLKDPRNPSNAAALEDFRRERDGLPPIVPYSPERAQRFIALVASTTMTLQQIAAETKTPTSAFFRWTARYPEIGEAYARARTADAFAR
jgi:hypothetical protein